MITDLFDYQSSDFIDGGMQYFDCVLKVNIGKLNIGKKVDAIAIDVDTGLLEFYDGFGEFIIDPIPFKVVPQ